MKVLLFGKNGQIGWALQRALAPLGEVISFGRSDADFGSPSCLKSILSAHRCDVIVNAAAYTAVDQAESDADRARAINEEAVAVLAAHAAATGCWLVHYSTDYVFDGTAQCPYVEADRPNPVSVYGWTKWRGEQAIADAGCRHLTFRTSWIHSAHGKNFVKTILNLAEHNQELRVNADQFGAPTSADLVADVTAHAIRHALKQGSEVSGLYHLSASGKVSWHEYARLIILQASAMGFKLAAAPERIVATTMNDLSRAARRPKNCSLDTTKLLQHFDLRMPKWEDGVLRTIREHAEARR